MFSIFIDEFSSFVQDLLLSKYSFFIGGDFNIHMNSPDHSYTKRFSRLCKEFNLNLNYVPSSKTHRDGNVIDFIVSDSFFASMVQSIEVDENVPSGISHHFPVEYTINSHLQYRTLAKESPRRNFTHFQFILKIGTKMLV